MTHARSRIQEPLTAQAIYKAAVAVVHILERMGYPSYVFGSLACMLYGLTKRTPRDVDPAVLAGDDETVEDVPKSIVLSFPDQFVLKPSDNAFNTFHILYYKLANQKGGPSKEVKVDIVVPGAGTFCLPRIPNDLIVSGHDLPLPPLKTLILLRLYGWYVHSNDQREMVQAKVAEDVVDIEDCLRDVKKRFDDVLKRSDVEFSWCSKGLHESARIWVKEFMNRNPTMMLHWVYLGFGVDLCFRPSFGPGGKIQVR